MEQQPHACNGHVLALCALAAVVVVDAAVAFTVAVLPNATDIQRSSVVDIHIIVVDILTIWLLVVLLI